MCHFQECLLIGRHNETHGREGLGVHLVKECDAKGWQLRTGTCGGIAFSLKLIHQNLVGCRLNGHGAFPCIEAAEQVTVVTNV